MVLWKFYFILKYSNNQMTLATQRELLLKDVIRINLNIIIFISLKLFKWENNRSIEAKYSLSHPRMFNLLFSSNCNKTFVLPWQYSLPHLTELWIYDVKTFIIWENHEFKMKMRSKLQFKVLSNNILLQVINFHSVSLTKPLLKRSLVSLTYLLDFIK